MSTPGITVQGNGTANAFLTGTGGDDAFTGSSAAENFLTGGGNDWVYAGDGDDTVYVDFGNDWLHGGKGTDALDFEYLGYLSNTTYSNNVDYGVTVDLEKTTQKLGILGIKTIYSFESVYGTGANDKLYGTAGANTLNGESGNDYLDGRGGADVIDSGVGHDTIVGGTGADKLHGYIGDSVSDDGSSDTYRYNSTSESTVSAPDEIWGWFKGSNAGIDDGDKIDLSHIDADGSYKSGNGTFKFIGDQAFHAAVGGEIRVTTISSGKYLVQIDTDKDSAAEMSIIVHTGYDLAKGDFVL